MTWVVGVDVGGTFTDVIGFNPRSGEVRVLKVPTARNQAESFMEGLRAVAPVDELARVIHGTTVATNAILEGRGARTGLLTTKGFRDILELGRRTRPSTYGLTGEFQPLVSREHRLEVRERLDADGRVVQPLDEAEVEALWRTLREAGVESVAVVLLHSYANHGQEARIGEILSAAGAPYVSLSHEVLPTIGEFERTSTTVVNAYVQPLLHRYLERIDAGLGAGGHGPSFRIMQSNGGCLLPATAIRHACRCVLSGPAAGVIAAAWVARQTGYLDAVSVDMGGTSFDVGLVLDGEPVMTSDKELCYGVPIRVPMVDVETIGAGGGSIIGIGASGLIQVGPESAGADPGPVCYGRGGVLPTITDANVTLGRLDVRTFIPGANEAVQAAKVALADMGARLGLDGVRAADAAVRVADLAMANAIKRVVLRRGLDPRKLVLIVFGGAGPLHGLSFAEEMAIPRVVIPRWPGLTSALGCILAEPRCDEILTVHRRVEEVDPEAVAARFAEMAARAEAVLSAGRGDGQRVDVRYLLDAQYEGQTHVLPLPLPRPRISRDEVLRDFQRLYRETYQVTLEAPVRIVNLRIRARAPLPADGLTQALAAFEDSTVRPADAPGVRPVFVDGRWIEARVVPRRDLLRAEVEGPACIQHSDATTLVRPKWRARADAFGNLVLERRPIP